MLVSGNLDSVNLQNCQLEISERLNDPEWDTFVASVESGHHVQTSLWAQVKSILGWTPLRITLRNDSGIVVGLQMLIRDYPFIGKVGYVSKGPVYASNNTELITSIIVQLIMECRSRKVNILTVQPPNCGDFIPGLLKQNHFQLSTMELAPTASILIDLTPDENALLAQIHKSTRNNIRFGLKKGITIHEGNSASLKSFYYLHICTGKRQNFLPYPFIYFETMQNLLEPRGYFQLLFIEYDSHLISTLMLVPFRDTVITKLSGWSGLYGELKPNDVLHWAAILWAKSHGYRYIDLEGINREGACTVLQGESLPEPLVHSPDYIKYKFGGKITLYPEAYDFVLHPSYRWIYRKINFNSGTNSIVSKLLDRFRKR